MTPKEKAEELYAKYYNRIEHSLSEEASKFEKDIVKQCALIAVDEIIKEWCFIYNETENDCDYWQEVKQEIEQL